MALFQTKEVSFVGRSIRSGPLFFDERREHPNWYMSTTCPFWKNRDGKIRRYTKASMI